MNDGSRQETGVIEQRSGPGDVGVDGVCMYVRYEYAYRRVTLIRSLSPAQQCTLLDWAASRIVARLDAGRTARRRVLGLIRPCIIGLCRSARAHSSALWGHCNTWAEFQANILRHRCGWAGCDHPPGRGSCYRPTYCMCVVVSQSSGHPGFEPRSPVQVHCVSFGTCSKYTPGADVEW